MLTTVKIVETEGHPTPTSNPFPLYSKEVVSVIGDLRQIKCSPEVHLPLGRGLVVRSALPGTPVLSWTVEDGVITVTTAGGSVWDGRKAIAICEVVEHQPIPVRFAQSDKQGRRMITGDVKPVENRDTLRDTESGE